MSTEKIDFSKEYKIEAIPSRDVKELREHGISTYPGITQYVAASWNNTLKRYDNTGFDENAPHITRIQDDKLKKDLQQHIVARRKHIEETAGLPDGYLKPTSEAWMSDLCISTLEVGQDLKIRVNGGDNVLRPKESYKDAILLSLILNNPKFPKTKASMYEPQYKDARFYITTEQEKLDLTKSGLQKKKKAYGFFAELFDAKKANNTKAFEVAYKLGLVTNINQKMDIEMLEMRMHDAIFSDKNNKLLDSFIDACGLDNTTLLTHNLLNQAITLRIVKVSPDGFYYRGNSNYRKTKQESVDFLLSPGNEVELAELRSLVEANKKKHKVVE